MKTILLVEDDVDIREAVGELLRDAGYDVREAGHGRAALAQLDSMQAAPCLMLLDLMMPVMSGPELLEHLHETKRLDALPVVVLSAGGSEKDAPQARKFIRKPADSATLLAVVAEYCGACCG